MGYILIVVGVVLIGFVLLNRSSETSLDTPPPSKFVYGGLGISCFLMAVYLLYTTGDTWVISPWRGFINVVVAIGLVIGGGYLCVGASEADQKWAANSEARAKAKAAETNFRLEEERRLAEASKYKNSQAEQDLRTNLVSAAQNDGMDVSTFIRVKEGKAVSEIDVGAYGKKQEINTKQYKEERSIDFGFSVDQANLEVQKEAAMAHTQLGAADRVDHYRIIAQLETDLDDLMIQRRKIELEENDEVLREQRVERINVRIENLKKDIDGRQNRLLSTGNGPEIKRLT